MSYQKEYEVHNATGVAFANGDALTAEDVNHIESGILLNEDRIVNMSYDLDGCYDVINVIGSNAIDTIIGEAESEALVDFNKSNGGTGDDTGSEDDTEGEEGT